MFMAFTLGLRHGFDLDHLSIVDSIVRTTQMNKKLSRGVGFFFSLGHGLVVMIISLMIGGRIIQSYTPKWLDDFGNWISIFFLFLFGMLTLVNLTNHNTHHVPTSFRYLISKTLISKEKSALYIVLIGALFAFSFDTFSQVALFSISASVLAGWVFSGFLGIVFMLGMMLADGLNGLFVSTLLGRVRQTSHMFSSALGVLISVFSLTVGMLNLIKMM